jgi:hypothetical protein
MFFFLFKGKDALKILKGVDDLDGTIRLLTEDDLAKVLSQSFFNHLIKLN